MLTGWMRDVLAGSLASSSAGGCAGPARNASILSVTFLFQRFSATTLQAPRRCWSSSCPTIQGFGGSGDCNCMWLEHSRCGRGILLESCSVSSNIRGPETRFPGSKESTIPATPNKEAETKVQCVCQLLMPGAPLSALKILEQHRNQSRKSPGRRH